MKLLKENKKKILQDGSPGKDFLKGTPITQEIVPRVDRWDYIKLKCFCVAKETIVRVKKQFTDWETIFASSTFDGGLIYRISISDKLPIYMIYSYISVQVLNTTNQTHPITKRINELNGQFWK